MKRYATVAALMLLGTIGFTESAGPGRASAQQLSCLHGTDEISDQAARRKSALHFARHINTLEANTASNAGAYKPAAQLTLAESLPSGFQLRLATSGSGYAFSVQDTTDPCLFGYFSDERGVIFRGEAIRRGLD